MEPDWQPERRGRWQNLNTRTPINVKSSLAGLTLMGSRARLGRPRVARASESVLVTVWRGQVRRKTRACVLVGAPRTPVTSLRWDYHRHGATRPRSLGAPSSSCPPRDRRRLGNCAQSLRRTSSPDVALHLHRDQPEPERRAERRRGLLARGQVHGPRSHWPLAA